MSRLLMTLMALSAAVACSAAAQPENQAYVAQLDAPPAESALADAPAEAAAFVSESMHCEIRATRTASGVRLEAIAHGIASATGEYSLVVTKNGAAGSSDISQGGEFDAASGETSLGVAEIGLERGASFDAHLSVRDAFGEECETELRS